MKKSILGIIAITGAAALLSITSCNTTTGTSDKNGADSTAVAGSIV